MENKIKCLLVKPYELPKEIEISDDLKTKQKLVGGNIECSYLLEDKDVVLISNREGKSNGMSCNRDIGYDIIAGPFLIVGNDYENEGFKSLTKKQIQDYKVRFGKKSIVWTRNIIRNISDDGLQKFGYKVGKIKDNER